MSQLLLKRLFAIFCALCLASTTVYAQDNGTTTQTEEEIFDELLDEEEADVATTTQKSEESILSELDQLDAEAAAAAAEEDEVLGESDLLSDNVVLKKAKKKKKKVEKTLTTINDELESDIESEIEEELSSDSEITSADESDILEQYEEENEVLEGDSEETVAPVATTEEDEDDLLLEDDEDLIEEDVADTQITQDPASTNASVTSTKIESVIEEKSPWSFGVLYFGSANMEKVHNQTATIVGLYSISAGYTLDNGIKFAVAPTFFMNYSLEQGNTKHTMGNATIGVSKGNILSFLGNTVSASSKVYLPTSYSARNAGLNGIIRADVNVSRKFTGKFSGNYKISPRYYLQSNRSAANFDEFGRLLDNAKANTGWRVVNEVSAGYKINDLFRLGGSLGVDYFFKYDDPNLGNDGTNKTTVDWSTSASITPLKNLSLTAMISQSHDIDKGGFSLLNTQESSYHGIISASF